MRPLFVSLILIFHLALPIEAVEPDEMLMDPSLEQRARMITKNIRCMVCQNESIDDSSASLAKDLRVLVREQVSAGRTDREIYDFIANRYGEVALFMPRLNAVNLGLYLSAPLLLLIGMVLVLRHRARFHRDAEEGDLDGDERTIVAQLLDAQGGDDHIEDCDHHPRPGPDQKQER